MCRTEAMRCSNAAVGRVLRAEWRSLAQSVDVDFGEVGVQREDKVVLRNELDVDGKLAGAPKHGWRGFAEEEYCVAALAVAHEEIVARIHCLHQPVDCHIELDRDGRRFVVEVRHHRAEDGQGQQGRGGGSDWHQVRQGSMGRC